MKISPTSENIESNILLKINNNNNSNLLSTSNSLQIDWQEELEPNWNKMYNILIPLSHY